MTTTAAADMTIASRLSIEVLNCVFLTAPNDDNNLIYISIFISLAHI